MRKLILVFLLMLSGIVSADTYSVVIKYTLFSVTYSSPSASCVGYVGTNQGGRNVLTSSFSSNQCVLYGPSLIGSYSTGIAVNTCPNGGTVSGSSCINAPVCVSPSVRQTVTPFGCFIPIECKYPESDNGTGVCANNSCPAGQTRNPITNSCQVSPICGSTEKLNTTTNLCELNKLTCPVHTHASTANDVCLADAPLTCPIGQHDNGTYLCIANDAVGCSAGQTRGFVNGILQCIGQPDTAVIANNQATAQQAKDTAQTAADSAASALAADPTNTTKQAANTAAQAALTFAVSNLDNLQKNDNSAALNAINQNTRNTATSADLANSTLDKISKNLEASTLSNVPDYNAITSVLADAKNGIPTPENLNTQTVEIAASTDFTASGDCPADIAINLSFRTIYLPLSYLCQFASMISGFFIALGWLGAARIVFSTVI